MNEWKRRGTGLVGWLREECLCDIGVAIKVSLPFANCAFRITRLFRFALTMRMRARAENGWGRKRPHRLLAGWTRDGIWPTERTVTVIPGAR